MADLEKVIKALEKCTTHPCYCKDCEYQRDCYGDSEPLMKDALELLKEQSKTIEELEDELHRTEDMLNHYLNGNE